MTYFKIPWNHWREENKNTPFKMTLTPKQGGLAFLKCCLCKIWCACMHLGHRHSSSFWGAPLRRTHVHTVRFCQFSFRVTDFESPKWSFLKFQIQPLCTVLIYVFYNNELLPKSMGISKTDLLVEKLTSWYLYRCYVRALLSCVKLLAQDLFRSARFFSEGGEHKHWIDCNYQGPR